MPNGNVEYSSEAAKRLVEYALQFQGVPYVWGGYSPAGFDCSGFVSYCLTNSGVLNTGHMDCNGLLGMMTVIPESEMQPGDIIFFQGTYATEGASHVGIYIGNGQMVHSGNPNKISDISILSTALDVRGKMVRNCGTEKALSQERRQI